MDWDSTETMASSTAGKTPWTATRKPPWAAPMPRVRINFRIPQDDLEKLKRLAFIEDVHYQTLIVSILHRYVTGQLVDRQMAVSLLQALEERGGHIRSAGGHTNTRSSGRHYLLLSEDEPSFEHGLGREGSIRSEDSDDSEDGEDSDDSEEGPGTRCRQPGVQISMWVELSSTLDLLFDEARRLRIPYSALVRSLIHKYLTDQLISREVLRASARAAASALR